MHRMDEKMNNRTKLLLSLILPLGIGATASFFTTPEIPGWYSTLQKPAWTPPNWLFAPVWTGLYFLMGIAFYQVWKAETPKRTKQSALFLYALQLLFNFFWSFLFFNQHQIGWAFAEIVALWFLIGLTLFFFMKIDRIAGILLAPYLVWVSFAAALNHAIWKLNLPKL